MRKKKKKTEECQHKWASLMAKVGKKTVPTLVYVCLKCGEFKVGEKTIRISRFRLDMGGLPIENVASIELGSGFVDTTLSRSAAGVLAVEGVVVPTVSSTNTLTNKRITPRVYSTSSTSSLTPDANSYDDIDITALAAALTINNPTGTPDNFQKLIIRIKDNGTAQTISWGSAYVSVGATLPTTTVAGKWVLIGLIYNSTAAQWQCVAVAQQ
jgi:hypothetical protein